MRAEGDAQRRSTWLTVIVLCVVTSWIYAPTLEHPFVNYDDDTYVVENAHVREGLTGSSFAWAFTSHEYAYNWHPLTWLSHMLDVELYGLEAGGHHATSLVLHLLNGLLLLFVLRALGLGLAGAAFVAAFFLWHPLRVESVAWVAERKDVLAGTFWVATLGLYARFVRRRDGPSGTGSGMGSGTTWGILATLILGLMAKPMLVTLPFVLLLLDVWPLERARSRRLLVEKLPFLVPVVLACGVTLLAQSKGGALATTIPFGARVLNAPIAYATYLFETCWPARLAVFHPHPAVTDPDASRLVPVLLALALLIAITAFAWRLRRERPGVLVGWLWFLGTLVPVIGLVQVGAQAHADRYAYLTTVGLALALVAGLAPLARGRNGRRILAVSALAYLGACVLVARHQVGFWRDSRTLFERALAVTERNHVGHINLGKALGEEDDVDGARRQFEAAVAIAPASYEAWFDLGVARFELKDREGARTAFQHAVELRPTEPRAHLNLGVALVALGVTDAGRAELDRALELDPRLVDDPVLRFALQALEEPR